MKKSIMLQVLTILALTYPAHAEYASNQSKHKHAAPDRIVFIDFKEDIAVLTTANDEVIFGKIKRFPSGQMKISFQ